MYQLIIRFTDVEAWNVTQHPSYEAAVSARERFLKAQRKAALNDARLRQVGRQVPTRRVVAWTAIAQAKYDPRS